MTPARILLVEDNEQNRYLATFLLERGGHQVLHARTGREGIDIAARERPDLIVMDIQMPELDGYEAARLIKANPDLQNIPIVAVTSYALAGDRERAFAVGFQGYIEKPISPETFVAEINHFLGRDEDPHGR